MRLRSERIICPDGTYAGEVAIEGGRIRSVGPALPPGSDDGDVVELGGRWIVPGYVDVHVHGGGGADCNTPDDEEIARVAGFHAAHGTTALVATTVSAPIEDLLAALAAIARCTAPNLLGAHLEGPFLNPERPGAMDPLQFLAPGRRELEWLLEAGGGAVRVMTLAPELPGALELVELLAGAGIVVSIGHTSATDSDVRTAVRAGASAATHVFNAMPSFHHREPGVVGAVLDLDEISCELICDGFHVDPVAMRLLYRAKGAGGIRLVTDAMAAAGMPDGAYELGGRAVKVAGGKVVLASGETLAGSTLTMEAAVQNAVRWLGLSIEEAVLMASTNSARLLGLGARKGAIAEGLDADLLVLDEQLSVKATMVSGRWLAGPS